jgi:hypothetical protein
MKSRITAMASLLLYRDTDQNGVLYVLNPATQRRARLPPCSGEDWQRRAFLVFDPAVSPHYKVLLEPLERIDQAARSRLTEYVAAAGMVVGRVLVEDREVEREGVGPPRRGGSDSW